MSPGAARVRLARRAFLSLAVLGSPAFALGRTHYGGTLKLKLPWPVGAGLDPHALDDALSALLGGIVFDCLFARDASGRPYPALAAAPPELSARGTRLLLRPDLKTAAGHPVDGRDVVWSIARARQGAAIGLLDRIGSPRLEKGNALALLFPSTDPELLADALASPVTAILPRHFTRAQPDATGAFAALPYRNKMVLKRNLLAARGAAFLDVIEVEQAADLADALRSFEASETDVGWLGAGYHRARPSAVRFDAGVFGWVILRTGKDAGAWGAPGVAQRLLDTIAAARLGHLGLVGLGQNSGVTAWGGPPAEILVANDSPHLREIAGALAALLSEPSHELRVAERPPSELAEKRTQKNFTLMLDFVRTLGTRREDALLSLLTAADPNLARRPPRMVTFDARQLARTLSFGVVGELHVSGACMPGVRGVAEWNLANASI